tara:strand:- start:19139 stop:19426 length:288 start_codon:yes stop_codon:yes gene_type:complete
VNREVGISSDVERHILPPAKGVGKSALDTYDFYMSDKYLELKTTDNLTVWIKKDHVSAVEEVPSTSRSEGYVRVYVNGYKFNIKEKTAEEILSQL